MNNAQRLMMYDANKKSALVAYLLWFFLGWAGAHRFYLGKIGSAIAILFLTLISVPLMYVLIGFVTWAIVAIWLLIDAFLIPGIIRDYNMRVAMAFGAESGFP